MSDVPRIFRIIFQVDDLERAVAFYSALLGDAGRAIDGARHYFDCGGVILAVDDPTGSGRSSTPTPSYTYFSVRDLEALHSRAEALDCLSTLEIHGDPAGRVAVRPWGERSFYAVDPFGNGLCFVDETTLHHME